MIFIKGKSYLWLCIMLCLSFFFVATVFAFYIPEMFNCTVILLPTMNAYIIYVEVKSKVALDFYWHAEYDAGTHQFALVLMIQSIAVIAWLCLSYFTCLRSSIST